MSGSNFKKSGFKKSGGRTSLRTAAGTQPEINDNKVVKTKKEKKTLKSIVSEQNSSSSNAENDGMNAYSALITLLNSERKPRKNKKQPKKVQSTQMDIDDNDVEQEPTAENTDVAVEGFVPEEEDAEERAEQEAEQEANELQQSEEDSDDDDDIEGEVETKKPFDWHFQKVDEKVLQSIPISDLEWENKKYKCTELLGEASLVSMPKMKNQMRQPVTGFKGTAINEKARRTFEEKYPELSPLQSEISKPLLNYQDILISNRTIDNEFEYQRLYTMHLLNHIYKTRSRVIKNNFKLSSNPDSELELRDQGFTRPKVLVLLPTKNACYEFVTTLIELSGLEQSENKKRFKSAFYSPDEPPQHKPADFLRYSTGNNDDVFCLGIKFTRKSVKLYSSFYSSDLIVASPLGLRMIIGNEGEKKQEYDFMSSLEIVVVDQADAMQMQSWENVNHIFKYMSRIPVESHGCDFSRVRSWYLDDQAKFFRQTIILSQFITPEINSLFSNRCFNIGGRIKFRPRYKGSMAKIGMPIRQTFSKLISPESDPTQDPDNRFKYLTTVVLPALNRGNPEGTLIFIPSYLDFTRIRNYMDKELMSFSAISEYSTPSQLGRARTHFKNGTHKYLLYTERLHYYRRYDIRGCKNIVFYGLPENPKFYEEVCRFLARTVVEDEIDISLVHARIIYSQWDALKLERVVGSDRVGVLYKGSSEAYEFQ